MSKILTDDFREQYRRRGSGNNTDNFNDLRSPNREQSATVYDLLTEGEIYGLNNGLNSIYLNGVPLIDSTNWDKYKPKRTKNGITCSGSSATITVPSDFSSTYHTTGDGQRYIRIQKAKATIAGNNSSTGGNAASAGTTTITTNASFFTDAMIAASNDYLGLRPLIRLEGAGPAGTDYVGELLKVNSATSGEMTTPVTTVVSHKTISCDLVTKVTAYDSSTTLTVEDTPLAISGGAGQISTPGTKSENFTDWLNFKNIHVDFRCGTQNQLVAPRHVATVPSAAFTITPNESIKQSNRWSSLSNIPSNYNDTEFYPGGSSQYDPSEGQAADTLITASGSGSKAFGLARPEDTDNIKLTFKFPQGMSAQKIKTDSAGEKAWGHAEFQIFFEFNRKISGSDNWIVAQIYGPTDNDINTRGTNLLQKTGMLKTKHAWGPVNFNTSNEKRPNTGYVHTYSKSAFFEEFPIEITQYKPFDDWRVRIRKVTADNPLVQDGDWQYTNDSLLYAVEAQVLDWLNYPHSAYSAVSINATDFSGAAFPTRQYEIRGIKCQVPTNYNSRYELGSTTEASYTRNITDGSNESTYQNWDGNFRGDLSTFNRSSANYKKVWTDNPAWVFYDLCTNKRYGLGKHISSSDIDKYALYQIAQYCDELVPDGEGGTEPRFSANLYLTRPQEAFKVIKDFASMFRGLLFWHNGKLTASTDREKDSVYTFTKGNVIGGIFSYEGSSKKLRTNQVRVQWNNPDRLYKEDFELVEDTQDIVDTNKVISETVLAYGCTSKGQATRYGKWKLLSNRLQKEIVSFKTGINAAFLRPGDVIEVQDADRDRVQFSGRVSSSASTTSIPLDRTITLAANTTYELSLIYGEAGCYLTDITDTSYSGQTFGGHAAALDNLSGGSGYTNGTYTAIPTTGGTGKDLTVNVTVTSNAVSSISINNKGYGYTDNDDITVTNYGAFTTSGTKATFKVNGLASNTTGVKNGDLLTFVKTEDGAANLRNSSNVAVQTLFTPDARIERQTVNTSAGSVSTLGVDSAFTSAPNQDTIWALTGSSTTTGDVVEGVAGSAKKYQINAIEEDKNTFEYSINALEYIDDKFNAVDRGWEVYAPTVADIKHDDVVPEPTGVSVEIAADTRGHQSVDTTNLLGEQVRDNIALISWQAPTTSRTDTNGDTINTKYEHIAGYQIEHTFNKDLTKKDIYNLITVNGTETNAEVHNIKVGSWKVRVRTVSVIGTFSSWVTVLGSTGLNVASHPANRTHLIATGGELSTTLSLSSSTVSLGAGASQTYTYTNPIGTTLAVTSASAAKGAQDFNGMGASATAYLVVDNNVPDLKAIELKMDTTTTSPTSGTETRFTYWKEVGAANNGLTAASGTVSITAGTTKVTGASSPNFDGDFAVGDFIKIGSGVTHHATSDYFRIIRIASDSEMYVDTVSPRTYSGASAAYQTWKPDNVSDGIIAKVTTDGSTNYTLTPLVTYKAAQVTSAETDSSVGGGSVLKNSGYLYYQGTSDNAPSAPANTSVTYTFSTGLMSGGVIGTGSTNWNVFQPTMSTGKYWYIYWAATEASAGGNTATPTFGSTVYNGQNFKGLVTFTGVGNTIADNSGNSTLPIVAADLGSSGSTTIDGGRITTGVANLGTASGMAVQQGKTSYSSTTTGFWLGNDSGTPKFTIGVNGGDGITFDGTTLSVKGDITLDNASSLNISGFNNDAAFQGNSDDKTAGSVGGWTISSTSIASGSGGTYMILDQSSKKLRIGAKTSLTDANTGVHVGTDGIALGASSVFKVTHAGVITAASGTIGGWDIASTTLSSGNITLDDANNRIVISD